MDINALYDVAYKENLELFNFKFNHINGVYIEELKAIGLSDRLNSIKEKCVLAEELGHYYCNATYPLSCKDKTLIDKAEYRAKKWAVKALISPSDFKKIKQLNLKYKWEIAEELGVTENIAEKVIEHYKAM